MPTHPPLRPEEKEEAEKETVKKPFPEVPFQDNSNDGKKTEESEKKK